MERGNNGRVSRGMLSFLAFQAVSEYSRLDRKPPVTAALVAANTLIYLRPKFINHLIPTLDQVWFNPNLILKNGDLRRLLLSPFYHIDDTHLVYNMVSLLWKGVRLENSMGSVEFTSMVAALLGLSQGITILLAKGLLVFFDYERPYYQEYAVGFSSVLFALKVVLNSQSDDYSYVYGLMVPSRLAAWVELILVQMFVPGVSFLGHLGGILAGIVYMHWKSSHLDPRPLRTVIGGFASFLSWPIRIVRGFSQRSRITGRGTVGRGQTRNTPTPWSCPACTYNNSGLLQVCEMCGTSQSGEDGLLSSGYDQPPLEDHPSLEELRNRRVQRFGRR
ncbi:rhomboid-like protein 14, mitochondrial [Heracleum sosnowskyi]|uniref:Rhomboid-like protein 14, mitochondrial n=1 Tax=Heracleum sosnowskyi TaxID=360622 RepID=A0AAD8IRG9_9APIA|nr:rhomboid-like protein 14, mitochondrial [Heracleum sosnowskyi]